MGVETLPEKMMAAQVVEVNEVPVPKKLNPNDLLVKVAVAGLCHTDFMVAEGVFGTELPCTGSHEGAGTVVAVGSDVKSFKEGDRVMCGIFRDMCGECPACKGPETYIQYCRNPKGATGLHFDGAFAEYVICDARMANALPDSVSFESAAPLACAGRTVWRGIKIADIKEGGWLGIVGSGGGLGHLGVQFAKALGINVVGVEGRDEGIELSKHYGADFVADVRKGNEEIVKEIKKVTGGEGVDAVVNVSDAKSAAATSCAILKPHGLLVQIAQPETVDIPFTELVFRDIRIRGSLICSPKEGEEMLEIVGKHNISAKINPFHGLNKIHEVVELAESGKMKGKGVVIVDEEQIKKQADDAA